jgi:predicted DNA-binding transcriptional regulator YafY
MPASKADELSWQLELLRALPTEAPGRSYEDLREELSVLGFDKTLRTVQRALRGLEDLGLQRTVSGKVHYWYWPVQYRSLEKHVMTTAEAVSLRLIEQIVSPLLPESLREVLDGRFASAREKLDQLRKINRRVDWPEKIASVPGHFSLQPPRIDPDVLQSVQEALLESRELEVEYQSLKDLEPRRRRLHPRALIQAGSATYLVATVPDSKKDPDRPVQYRIDRISKVIVSNRPVVRSSFDLKQYLADEEEKVGSREMIRLELWVSPRLAAILKGTALAEDQELKETADGAIVTGTVRNTLRLQQWLLGHREHLEVRKPAVLRRWMAEKLAAALARYQ